jgi:phosphatidylglycerophosphate synthase
MKVNNLFLIPCSLSLSRALVALLLLLHFPISEGFCLAWAVLSDVLDGFLARRLHAESRLGVSLDPIADKLFALAFVVHFYRNSDLSLFALFALFSRDLSLLAFWIYLYMSKKLSSWKVQSFFLGKVATALQFLVFCFLVFKLPIPPSLLIFLSVVGIGSFGELFSRVNKYYS